MTIANAGGIHEGVVEFAYRGGGWIGVESRAPEFHNQGVDQRPEPVGVAVADPSSQSTVMRSKHDIFATVYRNSPRVFETGWTSQSARRAWHVLPPGGSSGGAARGALAGRYASAASRCDARSAVIIRFGDAKAS
ncbi:MAG: hypothetical protein O2960_11850 [Verrucomicrobia bacterium]|nr:hypothetical protein [Verrucomicrobiota bacterium]